MIRTNHFTLYAGLIQLEYSNIWYADAWVNTFSGKGTRGIRAFSIDANFRIMVF